MKNSIILFTVLLYIGLIILFLSLGDSHQFETKRFYYDLLGVTIKYGFWIILIQLGMKKLFLIFSPDPESKEESLELEKEKRGLRYIESFFSVFLLLFIIFLIIGFFYAVKNF